VAAQQKLSMKAQSDCRGITDTLKCSRDELKRLEKQTTSVIIHFLSDVMTAYSQHCDTVA